MSDYRSRLFEEHSLLRQKVERLEAFIISDKYDALPEIDRKDLKEQLGHMKAYLSVLMSDR